MPTSTAAPRLGFFLEVHMTDGSTGLYDCDGWYGTKVKRP